VSGGDSFWVQQSMLVMEESGMEYFDVEGRW